MTNEQRQRARELFAEAVARPPAERPALLAEACRDDTELRAEVESLLEHHQRAAADFLRPPEPPVTARQPDPAAEPAALVGCAIGQYLIKSVIACGGMGTVYEAIQEQPERVVALKVMQRNVTSRSALRRFQFEAEVLGRLRHSNIAHIYDAGVHDTEEGRVPYFAMEYVPEAKTIVEYAECNALSTRDRLRLFAKICEAVHHGHQKGIIHRDLKPANILVDSAAEPKVIDFGIARATDLDLAITTQHTQIGQLIGTMQYMSPEQCDADPHDLDTRSDVYSLGVMLYELLTGELPYDASGSTIYQTTRIIKESVPRALSAINPKLRGDVETIALKALEKDRDRRYQSAADLAQDIRRHVNREPIEARPPTAWTLAIHWVIQHPNVATVVTCLAIASLIFAGTHLSVWLFYRKPHTVLVSEDHKYARLLSLNDRVLHEWSTPEPEQVRWGCLVNQPANSGDGHLALVAYGNAQNNRFPGSLCAYDPGRDPDTPIWSRRIEPDEILPELRGQRGIVATEFGVSHCWVLDVFPERPGDEVVVTYAAGRHSQRVVRIYDLCGERLYQVWHDGSLPSCYWMADAGLLVFAGDSHGPFWDGDELRGDTVKAFVVFALRPEVGSFSNDWLPSAPADDHRDPLIPEWYLCLRPGDAADLIQRITLRRPDPPAVAGRNVECIMHVDGQPSVGIWWVISESGEVEKTPHCGDDYRQNLNMYPHGDEDRLPDLYTFQLGPCEQSSSP